MKQKVVFLICCVLGFVSLISNAMESTIVDGVTWYYTWNERGVTIEKGEIPYAGRLKVPSRVNGMPVKMIGYGCFADSFDLISVEIPEGVTDIGNGVFARSPNVEWVSLPDSVTNCVCSVFYECYKLKDARIPQKLDKLCEYFFHGTAVTNIVIPDTVKMMEHDVFWDCPNLVSVKLPASLTFMDWSAFQKCPALKSVEFPAGFEAFGVLYGDELHAAFGYCTSLEKAIFNGPLPRNFTYSWLDKLGCKIFYPKAYAAEWAAVVPAGIFGGYTEDIGKEPGTTDDPTVNPDPGSTDDPTIDPAHTTDDGVDVVNGVTWYYTLANGQATIVTGEIPYAGELTVPASLDGHPVKVLGDGCFCNNSAIISVVVPDGVEVVGNGTFSRSPNIEWVSLPDSVTNCVVSTFYECYKLKDARIPQHLDKLCAYFFHGTAVTNIVIPDTVKAMEHDVFWDCPNLVSVKLPASLIFMDWSAFQKCPALKSVEFPAGFKAFGVYSYDELHAAFGYCTSLEKAIFHGPVPRNFASSWLDKLGCKIFYPKAYADDWAAVVPAEIFGGYTDDIGKDPVGPEPGPDPAIVDEITVGAVAERYAAGMEIEPIAIAYTGAAEKAKLTVTGLPEGLAFGNGVIAGAPDLPGVYTVVATVKAGSVVLATKSLTLTVANYADQLASGLEDAYGPFIPGEPLVLDLVPVAGWKAAQALPAGLSFNAKTGRLSGTPKKPGVYPLVFTKKVGFALHAASTLLTIAPLRKVALVAEGEGTVKGAGAYLANARVTLTAKAAKGFALLGWFSSGELVSRDASFVYTVGADEVQTLVAKFVTVAEDRSSVRAALAGEALDAETALVVTNYQGVALSLPLACEALTKPTVGVSGLPSGLSFKNGVIAGAPQTASALDKKTLAYKPKTAKVTVKTLAGTTAKYAIDFVTLPRPAWAAGSYDGVYAVAGAPAGRITATLGANGKLSGKVAMTVEGKAVTATLTAANLAAYDAGTEKFQIVATVTAKKLFEETVTFTLGAREENGAGLLTAGDESAMFVAAQNVWQEKSFTAPALPTGKGALTLALEEGLALKFGAKGVVTFAGSLAGTGGTPVSVSGTAQLVVTGDGEAAVVLYAAPKKGLPNGYLREILIDFTVNDENVVTGIAKR